jgi:hypothetical protein
MSGKSYYTFIFKCFGLRKGFAVGTSGFWEVWFVVWCKLCKIYWSQSYFFRNQNTDFVCSPWRIRNTTWPLANVFCFLSSLPLLPRQCGSYTCHRSTLNKYCIAGAGLPNHMIGEVSWDKKKMIMDLLVFNPLWRKILAIFTNFFTQWGSVGGSGVNVGGVVQGSCRQTPPVWPGSAPLSRPLPRPHTSPASHSSPQSRFQITLHSPTK